MTSSRKLTSSLIVAAFALGGCGILKKKTPGGAASATPIVASVAPVAPPPVAAPAETAPVAVASATPPAVDESAVPAPEDFEDEAFEKVTQANFKAELQRLTKEISAK